MEFGHPYLKDWEIAIKCEGVSYSGETHKIYFSRELWEDRKSTVASCHVTVPPKGFGVPFDEIDKWIAVGLNQGIGIPLTEEEKAMLTPIIREGVEIMRDAEVTVRYTKPPVFSIGERETLRHLSSYIYLRLEHELKDDPTKPVTILWYDLVEALGGNNQRLVTERIVDKLAADFNTLEHKVTKVDAQLPTGKWDLLFESK